MVYDGANAYLRVADRLTGFFLVDPGGPRGPYDPLWPLDALFGAGDDAVEIGPEAVRGVPATHCRLAIDLVRADAALPAGVSLPSGPYRSLRRLPAEAGSDAAGLARRISVNPGRPPPRMRRSGRSLSCGTSVSPSTSRRPVPVKSWRPPRLTAWPRRKRAGRTPDPACASPLASTGEHSIQAPGFAIQAVMNLPCADQTVRRDYPLVIQPTRHVPDRRLLARAREDSGCSP